jgi:hypothetical protein
MQRILTGVTTALVLTGAAVQAYGQADQWPPELVIPQSVEPADSNGTEYGSDQGLFTRTFKASDSVSIRKNTASYGVNQIADFELAHDSWADTKDEYFDLSGDAVFKRLPLGLSAGLEWIPVLLLKKQMETQGMLGSLEAGPVVGAAPFGVPILVHGGATARGTSENIGAVSVAGLQSLNRDKGYYAGAEIGAPYERLPYLPVYLNVKGYGRSMETSRLITGTGSVFAYYGLSSRDSVFACYTDSLANGRDAFLGQAQGKPHFIDDPVKNERSYHFIAGVKGASRYFFSPAFIYSYSEHTLSFKDIGGDRKNTDNGVNLMLKTDSGFPLSYSGGLKIDVEREDKNSFSSYDTNGSLLAGGPGRSVSLYDFRAYRVAMINSFSKYLENGMGIEYVLDMSRYSQDYPNYYITNNRIVRSGLDIDIIVNRHKVTVVPLPASWAKTSLFYEYSKNLRSFLKKERSGQNTIDWLYRVGGTADVTVFDRCTLSEAMSADAKVERFIFPEMRKGNPPPYSRKWSSLAMFDFYAAPWLTLKTEWNETYWDYGTWNGRDYVDSSTFASADEAAAYREYYAILDKSWEHGIKVAAVLRLFDVCLVNTGFSYLYRDVRGYDVVTKEYVRTPSAGSQVAPFASVSYQAGPGLVFKASVVRTFDIIDKFWDIHVSLNGVF